MLIFAFVVCGHIQKIIDNCQEQSQVISSVYFSTRSFMVAGLMFNSLTYLIILKWYKRRIQFHCSACIYAIFSTAFVVETILSPLGVLVSLSNISWLYMWGFNPCFLFYSFGLCVYFYAHTMLFSLLSFCSTVWNQEVSYIWLCTSSSGLLWLFGSFVLPHKF